MIYVVIAWTNHYTENEVFHQDFFSKCDQTAETEDLVAFTEEILNGKFHFLCSEWKSNRESSEPMAEVVDKWNFVFSVAAEGDKIFISTI